jgi:hypothetical protein
MENELRSIGYRLVHLMVRFQSAHDPEVISRMELTGERLVRSIDLPKFAPDDRLMARFLRRCLSLATWSAPTIFLVDEPARYRVPQEPGEEELPRDETLKEWIARESLQRWQ